jgi:5-methyltetrahydropteroyltriglutamate--homocysteine methyltransferase
MTIMSELPMFPTHVIGSLPRPLWVLDLLRAHKQGAISRDEYRSALDKAIPFAIGLQERAGIDIITDGEWRRETYFSVFSDRVGGIQADAIEVRLVDGKTRRWPCVVEKLSYQGSIAADDARFLAACTRRFIKVTLPSPYMVERMFYDPDLSRAAYSSRADLVMDAADLLRKELMLLCSLGVDIVQFDDVMIGRFMGDQYNPLGTNPRVKITMADRERELETAITGLNRVVEGIRSVKTALHVCRGHRGRQHYVHGSFEPILQTLYRAQVDVLALELAAPDAGSIEVIKGFPEDKALGLGAIDILTAEVDDPSTIVERVKSALKYVSPDRIFLNPDCGFAPSADNPISIDEAYAKLRSLSEAATILRGKRT